jgi:transposase
MKNPTTPPAPCAGTAAPPALILGIDIAKAKFDCCLLRAADGTVIARTTLRNDSAGTGALGLWLAAHVQAHGPVHAGLEATGSYSRLALNALQGMGHTVSLLNPRRIKAWITASGQRNKTDKADAEAIARSILALRPAATVAEGGSRLRLRALVRRRVQVLELINMEESHHESAEPAVRAHCLQLLEHLRAHGTLLEAQIALQLQSDPALAARDTLLQSIKGLGPWTSLALLTELPDPSWQNCARSAAAFAGVTPSLRESGSSRRGGRATRQGSRHLRRALYWPSIVAQRSNPRAKALAARLRAAGKTKAAIRGAVRHLLVRQAAAVLRTGQPFDIAR